MLLALSQHGLVDRGPQHVQQRGVHSPEQLGLKVRSRMPGRKGLLAILGLLAVEGYCHSYFAIVSLRIDLGIAKRRSQVRVQLPDMHGQVSTKSH